MSDPFNPIIYINQPTHTSTIVVPVVSTSGGYITVVYNGSTWIAGNETGETTLPSEEKKPETKGCACVKCREFNEYAKANQPDDTFMCYKCRNNL